MRAEAQIVEYLKSKLEFSNIKATPEALFAPQSFDVLEARKVVLVWLDSVPNYELPTKNYETGKQFQKLPIKKTMKLVVSVGVRDLKDTPELDDLSEKIEECLINYDMDEYLPLLPIAMTRIVVGSNLVSWRQLYFTTKKLLFIPTHN